GPLEYNTVLFLEEIEKELKNQINFSEIQFSAESGTISFPALVRNRVGCIKYSFDKDKMAIYKYRAPYPECNREERLTPYRILDSVKSLSFEYSVSGREGLPGAVRIKIEVAADEKSNESYKFEKVVYIPAA
ncbi:MAG: hypothetical protein U9R52_02380, partial [Candidatus Omnitrophota bacterium]|nr:hypothetical protein [Candidatus Omnitrophota bacterium]